MKFFSVAVAVLVLLSGVLLAQDQPTRYIFGEYYVCDQNREAWSDHLVEKSFGPIYDRQVEEGNLLGWGLLSHNLGGEWRRVIYYAAQDLNTLLDTRQSMITDFQSELADAGREFTSICPDHDDYIWASVAGSAPLDEQLENRTGVGYSTYYVCDQAKQARADEIVKEVFTPALNKQVEEGNLGTWTWFAHVVGGEYRRLMAYTGGDHKTLISAVNSYSTQVQDSHPELSEEFRSICNLHVDYLWDVQHSSQ